MTELTNNSAKVSTERLAYEAPSLTAYGSVRELTGGMSSAGSDMMGLLNMMLM